MGFVGDGAARIQLASRKILCLNKLTEDGPEATSGYRTPRVGVQGHLGKHEMRVFAVGVFGCSCVCVCVCMCLCVCVCLSVCGFVFMLVNLLAVCLCLFVLEDHQTTHAHDLHIAPGFAAPLQLVLNPIEQKKRATPTNTKS
jgi:hypothetical protein